MKPQERTRAILASSVQTEAKIVAIAIADHMDETGRPVWPSVTRLAQHASLSERTVQRVIRHAIEQGWLHREVRAGASAMLSIDWAALAEAKTFPTDSRVVAKQAQPPSGCHPRQAVTPDSLSPLPRQAVTPSPVRLSPLPRQAVTLSDQGSRPVEATREANAHARPSVTSGWVQGPVHDPEVLATWEAILDLDPSVRSILDATPDLDAARAVQDAIRRVGRDRVLSVGTWVFRNDPDGFWRGKNPSPSRWLDPRHFGNLEAAARAAKVPTAKPVAQKSWHDREMEDIEKKRELKRQVMEKIERDNAAKAEKARRLKEQST